jgi:sugar phosphate isomerase/epimerase
MYHWGHQPLLIERLSNLASRLALVQLGDARQPPRGEPNRCPLGDGCIPLREIVHGLATAGYDGFFEVELIGEEIEAANYRDVLAHSVKTFHDWMGCGAESTVQHPTSNVVSS